MVAYLSLVKPKGRYLTVTKAAVKTCNGIFAQDGVANDFPTYRNAHGAKILVDGAEWHLRITFGSTSLDYSKGISKNGSVVPPRGEWCSIVGSFSFSPTSSLRTQTLHFRGAQGYVYVTACYCCSTAFCISVLYLPAPIVKPTCVVVRYDESGKHSCRVKVGSDICFGEHSCEHVLSYQKRTHKFKQVPGPQHLDLLSTHAFLAFAPESLSSKFPSCHLKSSYLQATGAHT